MEGEKDISEIMEVKGQRDPGTLVVLRNDKANHPNNKINNTEIKRSKI